MPTNDEYNKALEKLKGRDKVGVLGDVLGVGAGIASGVAASGGIAGAAGASTLLGSSALGSLAGGVFVAATPVGWVIGSAAAAGMLGYGISKVIRSGGKVDERKMAHSEKIKEKQRVQQLKDEVIKKNDKFIETIAMPREPRHEPRYIKYRT